jgi:hypothetical protein
MNRANFNHNQTGENVHDWTRPKVPEISEAIHDWTLAKNGENSANTSHELGLLTGVG